MLVHPSAPEQSALGVNVSLAVLLGQIVAIAAMVVPPAFSVVGVEVRWPVKAMFMWTGLLALGLLTNVESCLKKSPDCSELSSLGLGLGIMLVLGLGVLAVIWALTRPKKSARAPAPDEDTTPRDAAR